MTSFNFIVNNSLLELISAFNELLYFLLYFYADFGRSSNAN